MTFGVGEEVWTVLAAGCMPQLESAAPTKEGLEEERE
jgi:hypothetical protein